VTRRSPPDPSLRSPASQPGCRTRPCALSRFEPEGSETDSARGVRSSAATPAKEIAIDAIGRGLASQRRVLSFRLEASAVVAAPRDLVWRRLVDRDAVPGWLDDVDQLTGSAERFATRRAGERCGTPIEGRVTELQHERALRVRLRAPWHLLREIELGLRLESDEVGTRVDVDATYHLRWLGWMLKPLVRLRAEIALHRAARGFRAALEDEASRRRRRPSRGGTTPAQPSQDALLLRTAS
jgi:uncharacterized protein YndB with AHSA1/START domain